LNSKVSFWSKKHVMRRMALIVLLVFVCNILAYDLAPLTPLNKITGVSIAQAAVADKDGLGVEGYWSYYGKALGGGWYYAVNTFSGNLILQCGLVAIPGRGAGLGEGLVYNSLSTQTNPVGIGWQLRNDVFVQENADGSVTFKDSDGTNHKFVKKPDGSYEPPNGVYLTLAKVDANTFTIQDKSDTVSRFQSGRLVSVTDENGNVATFAYDTNNRLATMTDPSGRTLTYTYTSGGWLNKITDAANRTATFGYYSDGKLYYVSDQKGSRTYFYYDASKRLNKIRDGNVHYTYFFYDGNGKLNKVDDARSGVSKKYSTTFAYDSDLLECTITDPAGKTSTVTHNAVGNPIKLQDGAGTTIEYTWDKNNLIGVTDANGSTSASYDTNGNIISIADMLSASNTATTTIEYDAKDNPTSITDANDNQATVKYDQKSNVLSVGNPDRKEADANTYDAYGNVTSITQTGAPTYNRLQNGSFEWTTQNGTPQFWYLGGDSSTISIDNSTAIYGNASVKISSTSETTAYVYSHSVEVASGQKLTLNARIKMDQVQGAGGTTIGIEYYDVNSNYVGSDYSNILAGSANDGVVVTSNVPISAVSAKAVLQLYQASGTVWFDGAQLELPINASEGHIFTAFDYVENSSFEAGGTYWYAGGVSGATTISTTAPWAGNHSAKINLTESGGAWILSEDIPVKEGERLTLSGFVKTVDVAGTGARVQVQYYDQSYNYLGFNAAKLQTGTQDYTRYAIATTAPTGAAYAIVFGNVISSTGTAYFDNIKLVMRSTTTYTYDAAGNYATDLVDPLGNWTDLTYDAAGNVTEVNDPKGQITRFSYDALDNLTSVTDALGKVSRYEYDPVSLQVTYRDARSASSIDNTYRTSFAYNEINQPVSVTDALGRKIINAYDDSANLTSITYPDGRKALFSYDAANRLSQKSYSAEPATHSFAYDAAGNLQQVTDGQARNYSYVYDKANRLISFTDLFGYEMNYWMDDVGNTIAAYDSNNKGASYDYGSNGQLLSLMDPSGRLTKFRYDEQGRVFNIVKGNGIKTTNLFDSVGRISAIEDPGNPGNSIYFYKYDANSNITQTQSVNGTQRFAYDALNRLTSWTDEASAVTTYEYDAVGNLTKKGSKNFTYNAVNEIINSGYSYDVNGNLTSDGNLNYQYDSENRLTKVTKVADGSIVATYEYDFRGLRISKTTAVGTTRYHWDDNNRLVRESDTNGNTKALYVYAGQQLVAIEKDGQIYYTHTNHRGDILAITDVNKNRVATYIYGPWGELLGQTGTFDQPFRYAGYYFDSETGMYYLKSRYYSSESGRFLTKDTFPGLNADPQTLNLYAYCCGNPVKFVDPDGMHKSSYGSHVHKWFGYIGTKFYQTNSRIGKYMGKQARFVYGYIYMGWSKWIWRGISWAYTTAASVLGGIVGGAAGYWLVVTKIEDDLDWDGDYVVSKVDIIKIYEIVEEKHIASASNMWMPWKNSSTAYSDIYINLVLGNSSGQIEIYRSNSLNQGLLDWLSLILTLT